MMSLYEMQKQFNEAYGTPIYVAPDSQSTNTTAATPRPTTQNPKPPIAPTQPISVPTAAQPTGTNFLQQFTDSLKQAGWTMPNTPDFQNILQSALSASQQAPRVEITPEMERKISSAQQASSLISAGSPLLKQAQARAAEEANARGLLNSSMGVEAGTQAMLSEAGRYGAQDASNYLGLLGRVMDINAQNQNTLLRGGLEFGNLQYQDAANARRDLFGSASTLWRDANNNQFTLQRDAFNRMLDREDTASAREYESFWRSAGWQREDRQRLEERGWQLDDLARVWSRDDAVYARNRLAQLEDRAAQWDREDLLDVRNMERGLQGNYVAAIDSQLTAMDREIAAIQSSDMNQDDKQAAIVGVQQRYMSRIDFTKTLFTMLPQWRAEWPTVALEPVT